MINGQSLNTVQDRLSMKMWLLFGQFHDILALMLHWISTYTCIMIFIVKNYSNC